MNINTFQIDFTSDLESFVKNPIQFEPQTVWSPRKATAPERHYALATAAHVPITTQTYLLESQNAAIEDIQSLLRIVWSPVQYEQCTTIHPIREQVWLFGYKWLAEYLKLLSEPYILRSEFYRTDHDRFVLLLGSMLQTLPRRRVTFIEALRKWEPRNSMLLPVNSDIETEPPVSVCVAAAESAALPSAAADPPSGAVAVVDDPATTDQLQHPDKTDRHPLQPAQHRRLILIQSRDFVGRRKTRKNLNS
jgi:hypothetical protein